MLVFLTLHTGAIERHVIDLELDIWSPRLACVFWLSPSSFSMASITIAAVLAPLPKRPAAAHSIRPDVPVVPGAVPLDLSLSCQTSSLELILLTLDSG